MEYISKIDGKTFTTKEALIDHLISYYSIESEDTEIKDALQFIQSRVPLVEIESITKNIEGSLVIGIDLYNENRKHLVNELITVKKEITTDYFETTFSSLDEVVEYLTTFYNKFEDIKKMITSRFNSESIVFTDIYTGDHNNNSVIYFSCLINEEDYEFHYDFGDSLEQLYNQINSKFVKKIEGNVENYWDHSSNSQVFRLNGVDIENFLKDGKRVTIEILD